MKSKLFQIVTLVFAGVISLAPLSAFAAFNDVSLTTDAIISVGGYTLNITGSTAAVQSIVVNSSSFSVTLASGSSFKVSSPTLNQLNSDVTSDVTSNTCTGSESSITLAYSSGGTVTNVITPSATICTNPVSSGGGGGGGGGGTITGCTDPKALNYQRYAYGTQLSTCQYAASSTPATATSTPVVTTTPAFTISFPRTLYFGLSGSDVSLLQTLLKTWGYYTYPQITGYFGNATKAAVAAFQTANGIEPLGGMGPITRAKILALAGSASTPTTPTTSTPTAFTRDLQLYSTGEDVRALQKYLNAHGAVIAPTGAGSVGNETAYFGLATQAALIKFQSANGIAPAAGYFGSKTRAFISTH